MDEKLVTEIREHMRRWGGWAAIEKYRTRVRPGRPDPRRLTRLDA